MISKNFDEVCARANVQKNTNFDKSNIPSDRNKSGRVLAVEKSIGRQSSCQFPVWDSIDKKRSHSTLPFFLLPAKHFETSRQTF